MIEPQLINGFWRRVDMSGGLFGCWLWTGASQPAGYGHTYIGGTRRRPRYSTAHRVAYEIVHGPVSKALQIDHLCRNHACVNPVHLEPVTPRENIRRGTGHGKETHCPQGHAYDEANTYISKRNQRSCRACIRRRASERYHARVGH